MNRIEIVTVDNKKYIVDHFDGHDIVYSINDIQLDQPLGYYNTETGLIDFIDIDEEDSIYSELLRYHTEMRKIDAVGVSELIENLQMANKLPQSAINTMDDPFDDHITPVPILQKELKELDMDGLEDLDEQFLDLGDLAEGILSITESTQLGNINVEKIQTGEVTIPKKKQAHEIIYFHDVLYSELVSTLQDEQVPASLASILAKEYLNIVKITEDRLLDKDKVDTFEYYKYTNPIIYRYLKNLGSQGLPRYHKYWLIPIVADVKKVYDSQIVERQQGAVLSTNFGAKLNLLDEIKEENNILSRLYAKTDQQVNTSYIQSKHGYQPTSVKNKDLSDNITSFENPDIDRQDYTIHVLRYHSLGSNQLELRKAYGSVYKKINKYKDSSMKKLTGSIIGSDHALSVNGEMINTVGFLRLPIKLNNDVVGYNIQTALNEFYTGKKTLKIYHNLDEIPPITATNINEPIAFLIPQETPLDQIEKAFINVIPSLETVIQIYQSKLELIDNLEQFNRLLKYYDLTFKEMSEVNYNQLVQSLRERTQKKVSAFMTRTDKINQLFTLRGEIEKNIITDIKIITDNLLKHSIITDNYGPYPDFGQPKDSDLNRLIWINKQIDNGRLFFSVLNYLEVMSYYIQLVGSKKEMKFSDVIGTDFSQKLNQIENNIQSLTEQFQLIETSIEDDRLKFSELFIRANHITKKYGKTPKPIVHIDSNTEETNMGLNQIGDNLNNVFILYENTYSPHFIYSRIQQTFNLSLRIKALQLELARIQAIVEIAENANEKISQSIIQLKLLQSLYIKNELRAQIQTDIKSENLISPDQTILDLFKHIKNTNVVKATEMYLKLIDTYGILSADENWIVSKFTQQKICCAHKKDQLLELPLVKYQDPKTGGTYCKICHESIGEIEFDAFGGYDADDNPIITHEGNVKDTHDMDLAVEMAEQLSDVPASTVLDCAQLENPFKKYACVVLKYLKNNHQLRISEDQISNAINLFYVATKISDVSININVDTTNEFIRQKVYNQYYEYYASKGTKKIVAQSIKNLANVSLTISHDFDLYILTLISAIITLELSQPKVYLTPNTRLIQKITNQQLSNNYENTQGLSVKLQSKTIFDNMSKIYISNSALLNPSISKPVLSDAKFPYIATYTDIKVSEYINKKFIEYYNILIEHPDIKVQYHEAHQLIKKLDLVEPGEEIPEDPEELLEEVEPVEDFEFTNLRTYNELIANITNRLYYLDQLRLIRAQKLSNIAFNLVNGEIDIMKKLAAYPVDPKCPTDIRQFYINYLMDLSKMKKDFEEQDVQPQLSYIQEPALIHKSYTMSGEQQEFEQLNQLVQNDDLLDIKLRLVEIDSEISQLNQTLINLQTKDRFPPLLTSASQSTSSAYIHADKLYDPEKVKKWKTLKVPETFTIDPIIDHHFNKFLADSKQEGKKLPNKIAYLIKMLIAHLQHTGFAPSAPKYQAILQNIGSVPNKATEISVNINSMKERVNHQWDLKIIQYLFKSEYFNQKEMIKRDLIKSYIYLVRYLISVLKNGFDVESVPDINNNIIDLIEEFKDAAKESNIFNHYKYLLSNQQIDNLVGVFNKNNSDEIDKPIDPFEVTNLFHYLFVSELVNNFKVIYNITDDIHPLSTNQNGFNYAQFVVRVLDLIDNLNKINDTTNTEINNLFMAYISKKSILYESMKNKLNKDEKSILMQQMKYGLKSVAQASDTMEGDMLIDVGEGKKISKEQKLDNQLNMALDIGENEYQGENEYENPDDLGDNYSYNDEDN